MPAGVDPGAGAVIAELWRREVLPAQPPPFVVAPLSQAAQ